MKYYALNFAQAYGTGQYGDGAYACSAQDQQNGTCTTAAPGGSTGSGTDGGALTNTGIAVMVIVTLACLIIFVSLLVRIWRRKPVMQPQEIETDSIDTIDARASVRQ